MPESFRWDKMSIAKFPLALTRPDITRGINDFLKPMSKCHIDDAVTNVSNILLQAGNCSLQKKSKHTKKSFDKKWFDRDLKELKKNLLYSYHLLQKSPMYLK